LGEAAALLKESNQTVNAFWVLVELGRAQYHSAPASAYRSLREALELHEVLRTQVLDSPMRMQAGGAIEGLFLSIIRLLVDTAAPPSHTEHWPAEPRSAAFELVERSRSRSLLELLGTAVAPPAGSAPADLLQREEEARRAVAESQAEVQQRGASELLLLRLRATLHTLETVQNELAETTGPGEEYVGLRRGDPMAFDEVRRLLAVERPS
jgi:hypothetical protein